MLSSQRLCPARCRSPVGFIVSPAAKRTGPPGRPPDAGSSVSPLQDATNRAGPPVGDTITLRPSRRAAVRKAASNSARPNRCVTSEATSTWPARIMLIAVGRSGSSAARTGDRVPCAARTSGDRRLSLAGIPATTTVLAGRARTIAVSIASSSPADLDRRVDSTPAGRVQQNIALVATVDQRRDRAEASRRGHAVGQAVRGNDRRSTGGARQLDQQEPDGSAAEHADRVAGSHAGQAEGGIPTPSGSSMAPAASSIPSGRGTRFGAGQASSSRMAPSVTEWPRNRTRGHR